MPSITIDGKALTYEGKQTILQVALTHGVEIPHYCYHPGLSVVASCRICLAEVAQPNPKTGKLELIPKLMPTCQTPAADGMEVYVRSPKSVANQKAVMEYLLINHPLDCPVCDQAGECHLQDYSYRYGRAVSRFEDAKIKQPVKDVGPHVKLYSDRCIMCSRCVRFTREVTGTGELAVFGRGSQEQIDVFPGQPLANEMSGNVVDICPVGALLDKDFLFTQRVWFLRVTPSIDGLTASGDNLWVHHNEGRIYRVKPRTNPGVNKWWISDEIRYGWKFVHAAERLRTPRRMQYGTQVDCGWPRIYADVAENLPRIVKEKSTGSGVVSGGTPGGISGTNPGGVLAVLVSPMLASEEAYLLGKLARALDPQAVLGVGPVPVQGENKTFPGGYTILAEKAPNARGVRAALTLLGGNAPVEFADFTKLLTDKATKVAAVIVTGNYPSAWVTKELTAALARKFLVVLDTLPSEVTARADVLLPGATWLEKAGSFANHRNVHQAFAAVIPVCDGARTEGQVALDLLAACGLAAAEVYDPMKVRGQMGAAFSAAVHQPAELTLREPAMQYVAL